MKCISIGFWMTAKQSNSTVFTKRLYTIKELATKKRRHQVVLAQHDLGCPAPVRSSREENVRGQKPNRRHLSLTGFRTYPCSKKATSERAFSSTASFWLYGMPYPPISKVLWRLDTSWLVHIGNFQHHLGSGRSKSGYCQAWSRGNKKWRRPHRLSWRWIEGCLLITCGNFVRQKESWFHTFSQIKLGQVQ